MKLDQISTQIVIPAGTIDLRPLRIGDEELIGQYCADPRVARMTTIIPHPLPPGLVHDFVTRSVAEGRSEDVWAMDATRNGGAGLLGLISLMRLDRNQSEVGYWVAPEFWGQGVAQAAVSALVAANPLGNATMFASVFQDNPASSRVLMNCGFEYLGDAESFCVARDAPVPTWTYLKNLG